MFTVPSPVQDLTYKIINASTVCIRWRAPLHKNGKLIKYVVLYTPDQNRPLEQWHNLDVPTTQTMIKVLNLFNDVLTQIQPCSNSQSLELTILLANITYYFFALKASLILMK